MKKEKLILKILILLLISLLFYFSNIFSAHFGSPNTPQDAFRLCPLHSFNANKLNGDVDNEKLNLTTELRCSSVQAFRIVDSKCRDNQTCTLPVRLTEFLQQPNLTLITEQEARKFKQNNELMINLCSTKITYAEVNYKCKPSKLRILMFFFK